ncbi:hypothetical protein L1987_10385 [Smallanthus sonchifolius]|uniref:Uncharacterized protein n=1 Tax=Smallanthus sonchifolius TaxID=185202 RepID=A0ACB9JRZ6_9ASTR|nr:hypothetical protein L1987_10385 [Smallanthus sonchifolius]
MGIEYTPAKARKGMSGHANSVEVRRIFTMELPFEAYLRLHVKMHQNMHLKNIQVHFRLHNLKNIPSALQIASYNETALNHVNSAGLLGDGFGSTP